MNKINLLCFFQVQSFENKLSLNCFLVTKNIDISEINWNLIFVNKNKANPELSLKSKDLVQVFSSEEDKFFFFKNDNQIIHLDKDFLIINKNSGIASQPNKNHIENNVISLYRKFLNFKEEEIEEFLPLVHRLDKPTTGLMVLARNRTASLKLRKIFKKRQIEKRYFAIVKGVVKNKKFVVDAPIFKSSKSQVEISFSGKRAITNFSLLKQYKNFALLDCNPETGRIHQIRKHLANINHPILFDSLYFCKEKKNLFLHSYKLAFFWKEKECSFSFETPVPTEFLYFLKNVKTI